MGLVKNLKAPRNKKWLAKWAKAHGIAIPKGFVWYTPYVGGSARELIRLVQARLNLPATGFFTPRLLREIGPQQYTVVRHDWNWNGSLSKRSGRPTYIILHNAAAVTATPEAIHSWHLARGFAGFGYHLYVRKDGSIHEGRPLWAYGAHTLGYNQHIGSCCEGNYDIEKKMPAKQLKALKWAIAHARAKTGARIIKGHREMPGNATSCPGRNFPLESVR